jgi:hypothetical protein
VHLERDEDIFIWDMNPVHKFPAGELLGEGINNQTICSQLVRANEQIFHSCAKVEDFVANDNQRFLEVGVVDCSTAIHDGHVVDDAKVTMKTTNSGNSW